MKLMHTKFDCVIFYLYFSHYNRRIRKIDTENVTFSYKDYRQKGVKKQMVLSHAEFIRRFSMQILPKGFVKIRHYGFLSSTWKRMKLKNLQQKLGIQSREKPLPKVFQPKCSCCKVGNLVTIARSANMVFGNEPKLNNS